MKILFLTDIHGSVGSFERAIDIGKAEDVDAVILGGDLHPIGFSVTPKDQRRFFEENYLDLARSSGLKIMAIMGNVDWKVNLNYYRRYHPSPIHWLNIEG
ncbi:MAG: metallophosphoesterase, partial [Thermoplasmata archaeon]|nr:metallophosphoesterase [Thermoplasmata archaeon]